MENKFYRIKAEITLNEGNRKTSVRNGYRPAFACNGKLITGHVIILETSFLKPGESGIAEISFIPNDFLKDIKAGDVIPFYEGPVLQLGYIVVKKFMEDGKSKNISGSGCYRILLL